MSMPFPVPPRLRCADTSHDILDHELCLSNVSKNVEGELRPLHHERERCVPLKCETLKTEHYLVLKTASNKPCDSPAARPLEGVIRIKDLATAYENGDGNRRGFHGGEFRWQGQGGLLAVGTISGMTNAGILREPVFKPACEPCDERGVMTGRLCGVIRRAPRNRRLVGCQVFGVYRLRFDPGRDGGTGAVTGTIEGLVVCRCPEEKPGS